MAWDLKRPAVDPVIPNEPPEAVEVAGRPTAAAVFHLHLGHRRCRLIPPFRKPNREVLDGD